MQDAFFVEASWRNMLANDLTFVYQLSTLCHPSLPESEAVLAEKWLRSPETCFVLEQEGVIKGYSLAHPWIENKIPALNCQLEKIPEDANLLYIHDVSLLPEMRSFGYGSRAFSLLLECAQTKKYSAMALVAIAGYQDFWKKYGFVVMKLSDIFDKNMLETLKKYGDGACYMKRELV